MYSLHKFNDIWLSAWFSPRRNVQKTILGAKLDPNSKVAKDKESLHMPSIERFHCEFARNSEDIIPQYSPYPNYHFTVIIVNRQIYTMMSTRGEIKIAKIEKRQKNEIQC
jgi:hypothetical protein